VCSSFNNYCRYEVPSIRTSFDKEIQLLNSFDHPNIIKFYGWDEMRVTHFDLLCRRLQSTNLETRCDPRHILFWV
jgi:hypothetical protein